MFDVRQAARGAFASRRPSVCPLTDSTAAEREKPAIRRRGAPIGGILPAVAGADIEIVHGCLNGTYYLITYDRGRHLRLPARGAPWVQGPRCASDDFINSSERGARAPMSDKDAVYCRPQLRQNAKSKLRRGGGS